MKNKALLNECDCIHCQKKLEQINSARLVLNEVVFKFVLSWNFKNVKKAFKLLFNS